MFTKYIKIKKYSNIKITFKLKAFFKENNNANEKAKKKYLLLSFINVK